jgi:hypothetical protein
LFELLIKPLSKIALNGCQVLDKVNRYKKSGMQLGIIPGNPRIRISREIPGIWKYARIFLKSLILRVFQPNFHK